MSADIQEQVKHILYGMDYGGVALYELLASAPEVSVSDDGGAYVMALTFTVPVSNIAEQVAVGLVNACRRASIDVVTVDVGHHVPSAIPARGNALSGAKNVIAVASGKGGVGKSTTAVNLAHALVHEGARVGVLDADIYGPSLPAMLGVDGARPEVNESQRIVPIETQGLQMISMGNLVNENTPMVWRGPMASGAFQQLLFSTDWDDVDYLIIDMPPGTGDIQLTLSQKVAVTGSVIVTTPQDIALLDAKKGIEMFNKVSVPVLGVVENMAAHICSKCGYKEHIFGEQGGERLSEEYGVPVLGTLPLSLAIRKNADAGTSLLAERPESEMTAHYIEIARRVAATVSLPTNGPHMPEIIIE